MPDYRGEDFGWSVRSQEVRNETIIAGIGYHTEEMNKSISEILTKLNEAKTKDTVDDIAAELHNPMPDGTDPWLEAWSHNIQATINAGKNSRNPNDYLLDVINRFETEIHPLALNKTITPDMRNDFGEFERAIRGAAGNRGTRNVMDEASYNKTIEVLDRLLERLNNPVPIPFEVAVTDS